MCLILLGRLMSLLLTMSRELRKADGLQHNYKQQGSIQQGFHRLNKLCLFTA